MQFTQPSDSHFSRWWVSNFKWFKHKSERIATSLLFNRELSNLTSLFTRMTEDIIHFSARDAMHTHRKHEKRAQCTENLRAKRAFSSMNFHNTKAAANPFFRILKIYRAEKKIHPTPPTLSIHKIEMREIEIRFGSSIELQLSIKREKEGETCTENRLKTLNHEIWDFRCSRRKLRWEGEKRSFDDVWGEGIIRFWARIRQQKRPFARL